MLYPLKFVPIIKEKVWGGKKLLRLLNKKTETDFAGESWEISAIKGDESIVLNGFLEGKNISELIVEYKESFLGKYIYETFGNFFPLLIKFIDAADDLSVQVHPDDEFAQKTHHENGKNEIWYIVETDENAELVLGLNKTMTKSEYMKSVETNQLKDSLNHVSVKSGDVAFIPAGRIHAIMKGVLLAEIQQTSDLTYRIFDWDRKDLNGQYRPLHNDLAAEVVDPVFIKNYLTDYHIEKNQSVNLIRNKFFTVNIVELSGQFEKDYTTIDSFVILMNVEGKAQIMTEGNTTENFEIGETVLLPACINGVKMLSGNKCKFLEIYLEQESVMY
jgi:mannose-6-phosphate isomerase